MKKFLAVLLMAAAIFSTAQVVKPVTAHAQDVWVASDFSMTRKMVARCVQLKHQVVRSPQVKISSPRGFSITAWKIFTKALAI